MLPDLNVAKLWSKDREIRKDDSRKIRYHHIFISTNSKKKKKSIKTLKASLVSYLIHSLWSLSKSWFFKVMHFYLEI